MAEMALNIDWSSNSEKTMKLGALIAGKFCDMDIYVVGDSIPLEWTLWTAMVP